NVAPTAILSGANSVAEGSTYTVTLGGYTDPGPDTATAASINWGDGTPTTPLTAGEVAGLQAGGTLTKTHTYADGPANRTIRAALTDEDGTFANAGTTTVTVTNVPPTVTLSGAPTVPEGTPYALTIGPVNDPGTDTISQYVVHWGDGATNTYTAAQVAAGGGVVT